MAKSHEMDMTDGPILKKVIVFSLPLMFSGILQLLFNAADIIVVGKFAGSLSLAAVGSTTSLISLLVNVFIGISTGANVLAAKFFGSKSSQNLSRCVHTSIALSIILGIMVCFLGVFLSTPMLEMMNTDPEVLPLSSLYLKIYFLGMPATVVYNFAAAILRAIGDTDRPLKYLLVSGVVNVVLNLVFVVFFHMDVAGVAIATAVSQYVAAILVVLCLIHSEGAYRLILKKLRFHKDMLLQVLKLGIPAGLQSSLFALANVMIQSSVNSFGSAVMAGNSAASNLEGFIYTAMNALYHASLCFVSQNIGAKRYDRLKRVLLSCMLPVVIIGLVLSVGVYVFGTSLLSLYISADDPLRDSVLHYGMLRLTIVGLPYALCGLMEVGCGALRGLGKSWSPLIVSTLGACGFRIFWIYTVFAQEQYHTLDCLYLSWPISWLLTLSAHYILFLFAYKKLMRTRKSQLRKK